ncbi:MAG TPA: ATP-binding cassette domain-containing protein [Tessaracoccus flavescens]|uniref:ABC transporter ATP-binding protein n=1 Tax=Tessaracoccus flavescens TaxID=399497 RepID=A0A921JRG7_9ACTN|nr:ATP-binding cassette domain-containing protein [Tessaracoccus flavescens]
MTEILGALDLTAGFPGSPPVLDGACVSIRRGVRMALLGQNGSGKTTLLRCLAGALPPIRGTIRANGTALAHARASLRAHRRLVQLVLQDPDDQLFSADVTQDVSFGPLNLGLGEAGARARVEEALELLAITHLAERPTHQLSYGERKRVAIAGAVAMRPSVLLLDEPTAGLDPAGVAELMATLDGLDTTVVLATHDVDLALSWADEVAVVSGRRVRQGDHSILGDEELLASARLRRPWQLELLHRLGISANPLPRSVDDVARAIQ